LEDGENYMITICSLYVIEWDNEIKHDEVDIGCKRKVKICREVTMWKIFLKI
jgi:hypothetical protein